jgi:hypothetical protein
MSALLSVTAQRNKLMETTTQTAEEPSALDAVRSKLKASISEAANFRNGSDADEAGDESTSNKESDRGTTDTSEEIKGSAEKETSQTEENTVASNGGDESKETTVKPVKESRENARIRELNEKFKQEESKRKELEAKLASQEQAKTQTPTNEVKATQETQQPQKQEIPQLVPPPAKPQYTKQQLLPLLKKYQDEGNADMAWAVQQEIEKVRDYEIELAKWEGQNARAWENHQSQTGYWQSEANKKWPELAKQDSTIAKAMQKVNTFIKDVQSNPAKFAYNQAYMADVFDRSLRFDAAEAENKQLREKIALLEKKGQPANQAEAPEVESTTSKTPLTEVRSKLKDAIRKANQGRASS